MENKNEVKTERKAVFVCVPIEKYSDAQIEKVIEVTKREYCKARNADPKDIYFMDFLHDLKNVTNEFDLKDIERNCKYEGLLWTADMLVLIGECDEVIFAADWTKSRSCKSIAKTCERYFIPHIRIMKGEKDPKIEDNPETKEYRKKHNILVVWK